MQTQLKTKTKNITGVDVMAILGADAIKTTNLIKSIRDDLLTISGQLYADIFDIGINVGLRASDLLNIKYNDINFKNRELAVIEKKTNKARLIRLNDKVINIVARRKAENPDHIYLFTSNANRASQSKPISLTALNEALADTGKQFNLKLSSHSLRKTFGAGLYKHGKSIELICTILNHRSPSETLKYIGITKDEILQSYDDVIL